MPDRPNILLILTDQWRIDAFSGNGNSIVRTPNVDRLMAEGVTFDGATSSCPICTPARASLHTGLFPHAHGLLNNTHDIDRVRDELPDEQVCFSETLSKNGYRTGYAGKWHIGSEETMMVRGYQKVARLGEQDDYLRRRGIAIPDGPRWPYAEDYVFEVDAHGQPYGTAGRACGTLENHFEWYLKERTVEHLEDFAATYNEDGTPFFCVCSFPGPHFPHIVPEPYISMYDPTAIEPWANWDDPFEGKPASHARLRELRGCGGRTWEEWSKLVAAYYGHCTMLDDLVGDLMKTLERLGLDASTHVVFTTDHGDMTGSHGLFNKGCVMYDEVVRIPMVVRPAGGLEAPRRAREFVHLHELAPTFLDWAGLEPERPMHGGSLRGLIEGGEELGRESSFSEYHGDEFGLTTIRMVRTWKWKYVYQPFGVDELYDLEADAAELNNLADSPAHEDTLAQMRRRMYEWMVRVDDKFRHTFERFFGF